MFQFPREIGKICLAGKKTEVQKYSVCSDSILPKIFKNFHMNYEMIRVWAHEVPMLYFTHSIRLKCDNRFVLHLYMSYIRINRSIRLILYNNDPKTY